MRISIVNLTIIIVVVFVILVSLPIPWHSKIVTTIAALSVVLVAYGIYTSGLEYEDAIRNQTNPANYSAFIEIQDKLVKNDKLKELYKEIYGNQFDPDKHSAVTIMAVRIQEANDFYGLSQRDTLPNDNAIINVLRAWANSPTFKEIWPSIKRYYKSDTDKFVSMLQSNSTN